MIRLAQLKDIDSIMAIVLDIINEMVEIENYQWNHEYPAKEHFLKDIEDGTLHVYEGETEQLFGFICVDNNQPEAYELLNWETDDDVLVIHRMGVSLDARSKGVGKALIAFAEEFTKSKGITGIRSDTYGSNSKMNALFKRCGYRHVGEINMMNKPLMFQCYEKKLQDLQ